MTRFWDIWVMSFKYSPYADEWTMGIIANHSNPKSLWELHLDGCERIDDLATLALVSGKLKDMGGA